MASLVFELMLSKRMVLSLLRQTLSRLLRSLKTFANMFYADAMP